MNITLFFQIIAWPVAVVYGVLALVSLYNAYWYEMTAAGRMRRQLLAIKGTRVKGYYFWRRMAICLVATALLISLN